MLNAHVVITQDVEDWERPFRFQKNTKNTKLKFLEKEKMAMHGNF